MGDFIEPVQLQRIGWMLLHSLWQITLLWILHLLCQLILRKARSQTRYLASVLFLFAIPAIAVSTFLVGPPKLAALAALADPSPPLQLDQWGLFDVPKARPNTYVDVALYVRPFIPWLTVIWIVVLGLRAILVVGGWTVLFRTVRQGKPLQLADSVSSPELMGLLRRVRIIETSRLLMPAATGIIRPCILFPIGMATGLPPHQLECVLAHELAHIRRYDYVVLLLQSVLESVFWFHPCVWLLSRSVTALREDCADDEAIRLVGDARRYGETLLAMGEMQASVAMTLGLNGSSLTARIRRLVVQRLSTPAAARGRMLGLLVGAGIVLVCAGSVIAYSDRNARDQALLDETSFGGAVYHILNAPRGSGHLVRALRQVVADTQGAEDVPAEALQPIVDAIYKGVTCDEVLNATVDTLTFGIPPRNADVSRPLGTGKLRLTYARIIYGHARDAADATTRRRWGRAALLLAAQDSIGESYAMSIIARQPDLDAVCGFDPPMQQRLMVLIANSGRRKFPIEELIDYEKASAQRVEEWVELTRYQYMNLHMVAAVAAQYKDERKQAGVNALLRRNDAFGNRLAHLILYEPTPRHPIANYELPKGEPIPQPKRPAGIPSRRSDPPSGG